MVGQPGPQAQRSAPSEETQAPGMASVSHHPASWQEGWPMAPAQGNKEFFETSSLRWKEPTDVTARASGSASCTGAQGHPTGTSAQPDWGLCKLSPVSPG